MLAVYCRLQAFRRRKGSWIELKGKQHFYFHFPFFSISKLSKEEIFCSSSYLSMYVKHGLTLTGENILV